MSRASADRNENRLTDEDRERMRSAVVDKLAAWDLGAVQHYGRGHTYDVTGVDVDTLERLAYHAIGCSVHDLRDSEICWADRMIRETLRARVLARSAS